MRYLGLYYTGGISFAFRTQSAFNLTLYHSFGFFFLTVAHALTILVLCFRLESSLKLSLHYFKLFC
jgi:hypothetical protein